MKKYISIVMCFVLLFSLIVANTKSVFSAEGNQTTVYLDGVEYSISIDNEMNTTVKTVGLNENAKLSFDKYGNGSAVLINETGERIVQSVSIKSLSPDSLNVTTSVDGVVKEIYDSISDLGSDTYTGQLQFAVWAGIELGSLLWALIFAGATIVLGGITYIVVTEVADELRKENKPHYAAVLKNQDLYVGQPLSENTAVSRLSSGGDVWSVSYSYALKVAFIAGGNKPAVGPEKHGDEGYYMHFHAYKRMGGHSFY
jgi:hypothetical protein